MKRYIKASFNNNTIPDWLKADKRALNALNAAGIDLANCTFSPTRVGKVGDNYIAYLVKGSKEFDNYKPFVWIPGLYNDDNYVSFKDWNKKTWTHDGYRYGGENSKAIKYFSKKDLNFLDTVYINIDANRKPTKEHYQDPRNDKDGSYAGQYFTPETTDWEGKVTPAHWSEGGKTTYTGGRYGHNQKRDKSGYVIPDPRERLNKFHNTEEGRTRQGEKAKKQLESIYSDLTALKEEILGDLSGRDIETFGANYRALDYFNDAIRYYKDALNALDASKHYGYVDPNDALHNAEYAQDRIDRARKILAGEDR